MLSYLLTAAYLCCDGAVRHRQRAWFAAVMLAMVAIGAVPRRAEALNPQRTLTQALHRIWQVQQGLPRSTIFAIRQTTDGRLWLGMQNGLLRFDGVRFHPVERVGSVSLAGVWVRALLEDHKQNLWLATDGNGLVRIDAGGKVATTFTTKQGLPSNDVACLIETRDGRLWVGTDRGLARQIGGKFTAVPFGSGDATSAVSALAESDDGTLWVADASVKLHQYRGNEFRRRVLTSLPNGAAIQALAWHRGSLWVGSTHGLARVRGEQEQRLTTDDGLADDHILALSSGGDGTLWIGAKEGFSRWHDGDFDTFRPEDGLSQSTVHAVWEDREGSLWVGTKHGLNQFVDRRTIPFTMNEGLPSNDTGPVVQGAGNDVWIGTLGAGLVRFDGKRFTTITTANGLPSNRILALAPGEAETVWVGTDDGLALLREGRIEPRPTDADRLPASQVNCLLRDAKGIVWAGTSAGLATLRDGSFTPATPDEPSMARNVIAMTEFRDEVVVAIAGERRLMRVRENSLVAIGRSEVAAEISALHTDSAGTLWITTRGGGLARWDGESLFTFSTRDGLYDDDLFGIADDGAGRLWIACSKGIFSVAQTDLRRFATGNLKAIASVPFSPTDALRTIQGRPNVQPSVARMQDGRIWISTIRGLLVIDPEILDRDQRRAEVVLDEVVVNGESQSPAEIDRLPAGRTNLTFRYTSLSYVSPIRTVFRYRLEGYDADWIDAGSRREAFYTNLPPGKFRFRVEARIAEGPWSEMAEHAAFEIAPRIYQRLWFWPVVILLAALGIWSLYRLRIQRLRERVQVTLAERGRIARELHDTLMQGFAGITMEMQALAKRLPDGSQRTTLEDIINDAGACLREARRSIAGLRSTVDRQSQLSIALAEAAKQLTESRGIRLKLDLDEPPVELGSEVQYHLLRIMQEAVTNAVKHSAPRTIEVRLSHDGGTTQLSVRDDGEGFDVDRAILASDPDSDSYLAGHYGLLGMRERAAQIGGAIKLESSPGHGTTVTATLRAGKPAASNTIGSAPVATAASGSSLP